MEGGASGAVEGDMPQPEFVEAAKEALIDLDTSDSTEFWLIQWPSEMPVDFDGQALTLKLHRDGKLGTFMGSSGKEYDVVSYAAQKPDATVFMSSSSGSRIVGEISRRVSLVHYPDPNEPEKLASDNLKPLYQKPFGLSVTNASHPFSSVASNGKLRSLRASRGNEASIRRCQHKSGVSDAGETSKPYKRRHPHESTHSLGLE